MLVLVLVHHTSTNYSQSLTSRCCAACPCPPLPAPACPQVRTLLSQNTTDITSQRAFNTLKQRYASWEAVRVAPLADVADAIRVRSAMPACLPQVPAVA